MRKLIDLLKTQFKGTFTRNIVMITSGAALSQIINFVFTPVITRVYTPEHYGVLSLYVAVLSTLSLFGTLNYEMGIPIAENDEKAINVVGLSLSILTILTTILLLILMFFGSTLLTLLEAEALTRYILLIPVGLFLRGLYNILTKWAYRNKNFKDITQTKYNMSLVKSTLKITLGIVINSPIGLLIGHLGGEATGVFTLSKDIIEQRSLLGKVSRNEMLLLANRYKNFPLFTTARRYLGDLTISLPIVFLTGFYGGEVAGFFGLANVIIQMPLNLLGHSISNVYYAECAKLSRENPERIQYLSDKLIKVLFFAGIFPFIVLVIWAPNLFEIVYGQNWIEAGYYARILTIASFARFVFKPVSNIFDVFERQKFAFILNIVRVILVALAFGVSILFNLNSYFAVLMYSISMGTVYLIQYVGAQKVIKEVCKNT